MTVEVPPRGELACCTEDTCEHDHDPVEPFGDESRWRCGLYGCMFWLWAAVDECERLAGGQHVMVRRYVPPAPAPEGQLFL